MSLLFPIHMNRKQRKTLASPWKMHCMYCTVSKVTSWAGVMSNSEKKTAHSISCYWVMLVLGISQWSVSGWISGSVSQSVRKFCNFFYLCWLVEGVSNQSESLLGLILTYTASSLIGKLTLYFCWPHVLLCGPYYTVPSYYMIMWL